MNPQPVAFILIGAVIAAAPACNRTAATRQPSAPSLEELASATYIGVEDRPITLADGHWQGEPLIDGGASRPSVMLVDGFGPVGDLDGDGRDETTVLLAESSGGSGTFLYLAVMGRRNGRIVNIASALVGDRVQVRGGCVTDGHIQLDVVQAAPGDAACCPSQLATRRWTLDGDGLTEGPMTITGNLSLETLAGPEWALVELGRDEPVSDIVEITLSFHEGKVTGVGGCNRYFATVTSSSPGMLAFSGMGTTRQACPEPAMSLERRYLSTLAGASSFSFLGGRLVLGCKTDNGPVALIFSPRETIENVGAPSSDAGAM